MMTSKERHFDVHLHGRFASFTDEIVLPTSRPTSVPIQHVHHLTHGHTRTLGHASTTVHQSHMTCSTRWSGLSAIGDDKSTDVTCLTDEVMTGCSSRTQVPIYIFLRILKDKP